MASINPYDTAMKTPHGKILRFLGILPRNTKGTTDTGRTKTEREKALEEARRNTIKLSTNDKFVDYEGDEFVSKDIQEVNKIGNNIDDYSENEKEEKLMRLLNSTPQKLSLKQKFFNMITSFKQPARTVDIIKKDFSDNQKAPAPIKTEVSQPLTTDENPNVNTSSIITIR